MVTIVAERNNRCNLSLRSAVRETPYASGITQGSDGLTGPPSGLQAPLSPVLKRLTPTAIPVSGQPSVAKGVDLLQKTAY